MAKRLAVVYVFILMMGMSAHAQYYWTANGTSLGGSGTWDTTSSTWVSKGDVINSTGLTIGNMSTPFTTPVVAWPGVGGTLSKGTWTGSAWTGYNSTTGLWSGGSGAIFSGTAGTVTVAAGGVRVGIGNAGDGKAVTNGIAFMYNTTGWTLTGGPITFAGVTSGNTLYVAGYNGAMTGGATASNPNLVINNQTIIEMATPTTTGTVNLLYVKGYDANSNYFKINGDVGLSTLQTSGTITLAPVVSTFSGATGNTGTTVEINGAIKDYIGSGSGAKIMVSLSGTRGTWNPLTILNGANTYTGGTVFNGSRVYLGNSSALSTGGVDLQTATSSESVTYDNVNNTSITVQNVGKTETSAAVTIANSFNVYNTTGAGIEILGGATANSSTYSGYVRPASGAATGDHTIILTAASGGTVHFTNATQSLGDLSATSNLSVSKIGAGTVSLEGVNNYSGTTKVYDGTLLVKSSTGNGAIKGSVGAVTVAGAAATTKNTAVQVVNSGTSIYLVGKTYIVTLDNINGLQIGQSVSGAYIQQGTVIVGFLDGNRIVLSQMTTQNAGATSSQVLTFGATNPVLAGTGTVNGATTVGAYGTLSPGDPGAVGGLTFSSTLTLDTGSTYSWKINSATSDIYSQYSYVSVGGGVVINSGVTFTGNDISPGSSLNIGETLTAISSLSSLTGQFSNLADGATIAIGNYEFLAHYSGTELNLEVIAAIPEPSTVACLIIGIGAIGMVATRKKFLLAWKA